MFEQILVAGIFVGIIAALVLSRWRASNIFAAALVCLFATGVVTPEMALQKSVNPGVVTLLALLLASRALERTSALKAIARHALDGDEKRSVLKLSTMAAIFSSFLNNTAVVAALIRPIKAQNKVAASRLLIPLSYAAILGGTTTLIGTSTNMVVNSFWMEQGQPSLPFFAFLPLGVVLLCFGLLLLLLTRSKLPERHFLNEEHQYFVDFKVKADSPLIGKTIEENRLRNLHSFYLVEMIRQGHSISPVAPTRFVKEGDRLVFCGDINHLEELQRIPGAKLFAEHTGLMSDNLVEVVVAERSSLIGKTLKASGFRAMFDAAVVGLKRNGLNIPGKLGAIPLKEGDSLLLAAGPDFKSRNNLSKHFFIISDLVVDQPLNRWQNTGVLAGFMAVLTGSIMGWFSLLAGLFFFIAACLASQLVKSAELKRLFPFDLWLIITAALTLAEAMMQSGLSDSIAAGLHYWFSGASIHWALFGILIVTLILTELVTNNAAAALMFPLAMSFADSFGVTPLPFVMAVAFGASACFLSPYGYQTNLLVYNTGGYKFTDFVKFGYPFSIMYVVVCSLLIPYFYPF